MRTKRFGPVRIAIREHSRGRCIYPFLTMLYAEKNGGPVLKGECHWWKISGFLVHIKTGHAVVSFRRHWSK